MSIIALLGSKALWLTYAWLLAAILASYISGRKGYGERVGLAFGLLLNLLGPLIWLFIPAKQESLWKRVGPWGTRLKESAAGASGAEEPGARKA
jgi:hypothetical protein